MSNPFTKASAQVGRVAIRAVDYVVENRLADAQAMLDKAMAGSSGTSISAREMAVVGAVTGSIAVAPGVGTSAAIATSAADIGLSFGRIATMVLAIGLAHGVDLSSVEIRKRHVYSVLGGADSELTAKERKAGEMKKMLGKQAVESKSTFPAMNKLETVVATRVGEKIVAKLATKELTIKMASLLPLGIGAGAGAIGNRALVNSVGRTANKYFASLRQR
jgi:EcsC protein family